MTKKQYLVLFLVILVFSGILVSTINLKTGLGVLVAGMMYIGVIRFVQGKPI